jgi:hypothetical protein
VTLHSINSPRLVYKGSDLKGDLLAAYEEENAACPTVYKTSDNRRVTLSVDDVAKRLFKMSFDPYQCVERRWGATDPAELASCRDGAEKTRWYNAQQPLRNQIDRTYDVEMSNSVEQLERGPFGLNSGRGVTEAPEVDIKSWLKGQMSQRAAQN